MKRSFFLWFLFILSVFSYAQNGYKEYTWGMSVNQVRAISTDLEAEKVPEYSPFGDIARYALMYLHYSDFVIKDFYSFPDPMKYESGIITKYLSKQNGLSFYFLSDRLVAVEIRFWMIGIISDLEHQNGKVNPISWLGGRNQTASWNKDTNRIIYWFSTGDTEWVTYIDKKWLAPLIDKAMEEYKRAQSNERSRLD